MTIKAEYGRLQTIRDPYLQRARECAKYTLPALVPPSGATGASRLRVTYSSFGARCVNSLSNKLLLALLPPRHSFFRLSITKAYLEKLGGGKVKAEADKALASIESEVLEEINSTPTRTPTGEALKHLIVAGNVLLYVQPEGGLKVFPLSQYVVVRDKAGNVLTIIVEEKTSLPALPPELRLVVESKLKARKGHGRSLDEDLCIYTIITRDRSFTEMGLPGDVTDGRWHVRQEVEGVELAESRGTYPADTCAWLPLRWAPDSTGPYGRGMVEDYLGHLVSLESLTASLVKATAISAKVVFLRKPNGTTKATKLTQAETGAVIDGQEGDITVVQAEKRSDLQTARETINDLKEELAYAFALNQAIQRNAERVTAEEIRFMAQELDSTLGGVYSTLSMELQLPFLRRLLLQMQRAGRLPSLPRGTVRPVITTGLDALGRGADLDNLRAFVKDVVDLGGPEALDSELNFSDLLSRLATARGIQQEGLVKSPEEREAALAAKQQQALIAQLGPNAVNAVGGMAKQAMANGASPTSPT